MKTICELTSLQGRVALITGATGHIGRTFAHTLAEAGAAIALLDLDIVLLKQVAEEVGRTWNVQTCTIPVNLADEAAVRQVPETILQILGRLDILINCAAFVGTSSLQGWAVPFEQQSTETWRQALEVNLTSAFTLVQSATAALRASGYGSIINIGSIYGVVGPDLRLYEGTNLGNPAAYAASKGGLVQMTRWWATVLAPEIRVNCISPGGIWRHQSQTFVDQYVARTPLGRMGTETDLQGAVLFFASDLSAYVTGQNLLIDGGWTAW